MQAPPMPGATPPVAAAGEDAAYQRFCAFLERACGITLGEGKAYLVRSRLARIQAERGFASLAALVASLEGRSDEELRLRVVDAMTTNETLWFRDGHPFETLKELVLPECLAARRERLRIWSAACSSGQEPYSISMCVSEFQASRPGVRLPTVEIVGTDISPTMLAQARSGEYEELELARGLSPERRRRFFLARGARSVVSDEVRARVSFRELNLLHGYGALGQFDVIFCRNVLIYFSNANKSDMLARMARALVPRGFLFLGGSEPIANYSDEYEMVRHERGVLYRRRS